MMANTMHRRMERTDSILAAGSRFSKYKPEEEKAVRKGEVAENKAVAEMLKVFNGLKYGAVTDSEGFYSMAVAFVNRLEYSAKDVELFSLALNGLQIGRDEMLACDHMGRWLCYTSTKVGMFVSALVNKGKDGDYIIHTENHQFSACYLGYKNTKNITVMGPVGDYAGCILKKGKMVVDGYAGGNLGTGMRGGTIRVKGNAGLYVGEAMEGGKIYLEGDYNSIAEDAHGRIYHKGKLIVGE
jgi:hypothetical protein